MRSIFRCSFMGCILAGAVACSRGAADTSRSAAVTATPTSADSLARDSLYGVPAARNIRIVQAQIDVRNLPAGWDGIRIAALSDFQIGLWPDNEEVAAAAARAALAAKPDAIVLLGDFVARGADYSAIDRVLAPLRGKRVFAVLGHTDRIDDPENPDTIAPRVVAALERNGVRVLRNSRAPLVRGRDTAYIAGLEPFVARRQESTQAAIFGSIPGGPRTPLLLSHLAAVAPRLPNGKWPAVLAGHAFCGRVEVPETPRLSWINSQVLPAANGSETQRIYGINGSTLFITCGTGYSFVPVRYGAQPEVAIVTLRRVGAVQPDSAAAAPGGVNLDSLATALQQQTAAREDSAARRDSAQAAEEEAGGPVE